jgi:hypothetical protein
MMPKCTKIVHLAATVGCILYRLLYWKLFRDYKRDKWNMAHTSKTNIE